MSTWRGARGKVRRLAFVRGQRLPTSAWATHGPFRAHYCHRFRENDAETNLGRNILAKSGSPEEIIAAHLPLRKHASGSANFLATWMHTPQKEGATSRTRMVIKRTCRSVRYCCQLSASHASLVVGSSQLRSTRVRSATGSVTSSVPRVCALRTWECLRSGHRLPCRLECTCLQSRHRRLRAVTRTD